MCKANFRIGYHPCVREEAIDLLMAGNSKAYVARTMKVTYPTVINWLSSYRLAEAEIDGYIRNLNSPTASSLNNFTNQSTN